jgi:hypothetical protein
MTYNLSRDTVIDIADVLDLDVDRIVGMEAEFDENGGIVSVIVEQITEDGSEISTYFLA